MWKISFKLITQLLLNTRNTLLINEASNKHTHNYLYLDCFHSTNFKSTLHMPIITCHIKQGNHLYIANNKDFDKAFMFSMNDAFKGV